MYNPWIDTYLRYCKMTTDTMTVLNHRLPILQEMTSNPAAAYDPLNWLELNRMVSEKMLAFGQANLMLAIGVAQWPLGKAMSAQNILQLQEKSLRPVNRALAANARRVRKKSR